MPFAMTKARVKKWATFSLRWGIAIVGMYIVISNISLRDTVFLLGKDKTQLVRAQLAEPVAAGFESAPIIDPWTRETRTVERGAYDGVYTEPDTKTVDVVRVVNGEKVTEKRRLLAVQLRTDLKQAQRFVINSAERQRWEDAAPWGQRFLRKLPLVERLGLVSGPPGEGEVALWHDDALRRPEIAGVLGYKLEAARPPVQVGVLTMLRGASPLYLWLSLLIFPTTYIITSIRWHQLLAVLEIRLTLVRTFVLNMVGAFYNTFMPGSTGGDVLKAYYASKQTPHRTRAVMSVFIDRVLGLLALVVVGGVMAGYQYWAIGNPGDPIARLCLKIAVASAAILVGLVVGLVVFYQPTLRRLSGLDWFIRKLPMQKQVQNAVQVMDMYRQRPLLILWAIVMTLPVHLTVAASAMLAGKALHLHISPLYYFVCVPVIVLAGSIPISPQGAGVMEYFAIKLTEKQGASVSEAFALTMSIRLVQVLWNLTGGLLVLKGGYQATGDGGASDDARPPDAAAEGRAAA